LSAITGRTFSEYLFIALVRSKKPVVVAPILTGDWLTVNAFWNVGVAKKRSNIADTVGSCAALVSYFSILLSISFCGGGDRGCVDDGFDTVGEGEGGGEATVCDGEAAAANG
jgi:hypothetical protein